MSDEGFERAIVATITEPRILFRRYPSPTATGTGSRRWL